MQGVPDKGWQMVNFAGALLTFEEYRQSFTGSNFWVKVR